MQPIESVFNNSIQFKNKGDEKEIIDQFLKFDKATRNHSQRVNRLIKAYLANIHTSEKVINEIQASILLHDIGKLAIPDVISQKGKLSEEDYLLARLHTLFGYILGSNLKLKASYLKAIFTHHNTPQEPNYVLQKEIIDNMDIIYDRSINVFQISKKEVDNIISKLFTNWNIINKSNLMSDVITIWDSFDAATSIYRKYNNTKPITDIVLEFKDLFGKQFNKEYKASFLTFVRTKAFIKIVTSEYSHSSSSMKGLSQECIRGILN